MSLSAKQKEFIVASQAIYGVNATITREEIDHVVETLVVPYPHWLINKSTYRVGRGSYLVPTLDETPVAITLAAPEMSVELIANTRHFRQPKMVDESAPTVPEVYADYVPFGFLFVAFSLNDSLQGMRWRGAWRSFHDMYLKNIWSTPF